MVRDFLQEGSSASLYVLEQALYFISDQHDSHVSSTRLVLTVAQPRIIRCEKKSFVWDKVFFEQTFPLDLDTQVLRVGTDGLLLFTC